MAEREQIIRSSGLFDADWYAARYPDAGSPDRALIHFLKAGAKKGFDPGPAFCTRAYLADHPDVAVSGMNPLLHYLRFGRAEGRVARDSHGRPAGGGNYEGITETELARIQAAFDPRFYLATNPDLPDDTDAFAHFMRIGWMQLRDPVDWFSVEHYLRTHGDISAKSTNPFAHYLLTGCREGRNISASIRETEGQRPGDSPLRTAVVAMVKNEADIIRCFASHVLALFDEIVIVDHRSDDGTGQFLNDLAASHAQVTLLTLEEPSYIQSVTMTHVVREVEVLKDVSWVFFLDADEFLPFETKEAFHAALATHARCPVIAMHWWNLIPESYWTSEVEITGSTGFLVPPKASPFRKIAFQPGRAPLHRAVVAQGNHALSATANGLELPAFEVDFPLLHVPVRSADQILLKLNQGVLAYQKLGLSRDAGQGTHWSQLKEASADTSLSAGHLNAMAVGYSEPKDRIDPLSNDDLQNAGYRAETFVLARRETGLPPVRQRDIGEKLMRLYAQDFTHAATSDTLSATRLKTQDGCLVRADSGAEYAALAARAPGRDMPSITNVLKGLLKPGYRAIDALFPSDWTGHVPFMFALADVLRPRRFVELGTLWGTSFFAFAQAVRQGQFDCDAVAVSSWAVEEHRQADFVNVFENFQFVAQRYADFTGILRMDMNAAIHRFDDGSVDLLHLDGFADYAGLVRTLDLWRPKLSTSGVVLLHNIHAHGPDFGVWRLWDELRATVPTIEFRHDQGLGLACLGTDVPPDIAVLAAAFQQDADLRILLQEHFERMGEQSSELFSRRYDMAQLEQRAASEGALSEEVSWLRQELAASRADADDLRELVKKEMRHAVGR